MVRWDWENNNTWDTDYSYSKTITHQYANAETYVVSLEVKDPQGLTDKITNTLTVSGNGNLPPELPGNPSPANNAENQAISGLDLDWTCSDPDGDELKYDFYFGTNNPPELISEKQSASNYNPGELNYSTTYYWKIVAFDTHNAETIGNVWQFTTLEEPTACPETFTDPRDGGCIQQLRLEINAG